MSGEEALLEFPAKVCPSEKLFLNFLEKYVRGGMSFRFTSKSMSGAEGFFFAVGGCALEA